MTAFPEFARAERFDGVFFIDLPSTWPRRLIWRIYLERFEHDPGQPRPQDEGWTAVTAAESVERLRNWASGRCLRGIFRLEKLRVQSAEFRENKAETNVRALRNLNSPLSTLNFF